MKTNTNFAHLNFSIHRQFNIEFQQIELEIKTSTINKNK